MFGRLSALLRWILILTLGPYLLVVAHELGHYFMAQSINVGIYEYSVGEGPELFSAEIGETKFKLHLIPAGGHNLPVHTGLLQRIERREGAAEIERLRAERPQVISMLEDESRFLDLRSPGERFLVYAAGLFVQLVVAIGMLYLLLRKKQQILVVSTPREAYIDIRRRLFSVRTACWILFLQNVLMLLDNFMPIPGLDGFFMLIFAAEHMYGAMGEAELLALLDQTLPFYLVLRIVVTFGLIWMISRRMVGPYRIAPQNGPQEGDTR